MTGVQVMELKLHALNSKVPTYVFRVLTLAFEISKELNKSATIFHLLWDSGEIQEIPAKNAKVPTKWTKKSTFSKVIRNH